MRRIAAPLLSLFLAAATSALAADVPAGTKVDLRLDSAPTIRADRLAAVRDAGVELFRTGKLIIVVGRLGDRDVDEVYRGLVDRSRLRITFDPPVTFKSLADERAVREVVIGVADIPDIPYTPSTLYAIDADRQLLKFDTWDQWETTDKLADALAAAVPNSPRPAATHQSATRPATTTSAPAADDEDNRAIKRAITEMSQTARAMYDELAKVPPGPDRPSPELLYQWSKRLQFVTDLRTGHGHLDRMRQRLTEEEALHARGTAPLANVLAYRYFVAEAELEHAFHASLHQAQESTIRQFQQHPSPASKP